jgi:hypothetical protein
MSDTVAPDPGVRQLRRLEILTDVIYGLVVFRLFLLFPSPTGDGRSWSSLVEYFDHAQWGQTPMARTRGAALSNVVPRDLRTPGPPPGRRPSRPRPRPRPPSG